MVVTVGPLIEYDGFLTRPPQCWQVPAEGWNAEDGSSIDGGRYLPTEGVVQGQGEPKMQDTYLTGTADREGRAFTVVTGQWQDDWVSPQTDKYGLLFPDSSAGATAEVVSADTTSGPESAEIVLGRGYPPSGSDDAHTRAGGFCYLQLCYGSMDQGNLAQDYRLALEWGNPIHIDYTRDNGQTWSIVKLFRDLGTVERYLRDHDNNVRLRVSVDRAKKKLSFEVGDGNFATHAPPYLPSTGHIRLRGQNGWMSLEYYPLRFQPVTVSKSARDFGEEMDPAGAFLTGNGLAETSEDQVTQTSINSQDARNIWWQARGSMPDAGDNLGSADPPVLSDASLLFPAEWTFMSGSAITPALQQLATIRVDELSVFDPMTRTGATSAMVTASNRLGQYTGALGNRRVEIAASVGGPFVTRLTGVAGASERGLELMRQDPTRVFRVPCQDFSYKMQRAWEQEVCFDGWALWSVVRFCLESGNIHPQYMNNLPLYVPPGASPDAPYGPAGFDAPDDLFLFPKGTGNNPRYRFGPEWSPWQILQSIILEMGQVDFSTGLSTPYYMAFDVHGQFHFEPFNPGGLFTDFPTITYSTDACASGGIQIEEISVYNSIEQLRTDIDFQGLDPDTNELLYIHLPMPPEVLEAVGFRFGWLERSSRFTPGYIETLAAAAQMQAAQATQVAFLKAPFMPGVFAGQTCWIIDAVAVGGANQFVIEEIRSSYGAADVAGLSGQNECGSYITARSVNAYM
jgi:hypothetical protein